MTDDPRALAEVGRTIGRLATEVLPGPRDVLAHVTVLPKPGPAWVRRVGRNQLWLAYRFDHTTLSVLGVNTNAPIPL